MNRLRENYIDDDRARELAEATFGRSYEKVKGTDHLKSPKPKPRQVVRAQLIGDASRIIAANQACGRMKPDDEIEYLLDIARRLEVWVNETGEINSSETLAHARSIVDEDSR